MNRDFPCFTHLHLLSSDLFSSELSRLSDSSLLCFSSVHIVGSLASKLPSTIHTHLISSYSHDLHMGNLPRYDDKFGLVERCSAMTLASLWNCLELLGLTLLGGRRKFMAREGEKSG